MANENIVERFEFKTQIHTAYDGTEQRAALREEPRRFFSFNYISVDTWQSQYLRMLIISRQNNTFKIPAWHRLHTIQEDINRGDYYYQADKRYLWTYRDISGVFFSYGDKINGGGSYYDIVNVSASGAIKLKKFSAAARKKGDFVCPVFTAVIQDSNDLNALFSNDTNLTMNFEIVPQDYGMTLPPSYDYMTYRDDDTFILDNIKLPDQYNGLEVFKLWPPWSREIDMTYEKNVVKLDNETGSFYYDMKSHLIAENREIEYITLDVEETNNLQRFFFRCKGCLVPFYAPTWLHDITLDKDKPSSESFLSTQLTDFYRYYSDLPTRKNLIVFLNNGKTITSSIVGFSTYIDSKNIKHGKILLGDNIGDLRINDVRMISFLCKYRLASDILEIAYDTTGIGSAKIALKEVLV